MDEVWTAWVLVNRNDGNGKEGLSWTWGWVSRHSSFVIFQSWILAWTSDAHASVSLVSREGIQSILLRSCDLLSSHPLRPIFCVNKVRSIAVQFIRALFTRLL
ncbi:hypothetical protein ACGC1H_005412 [Rhizoctonia solani]